MTTGTKIFLALFALIVGTLVVYYGVVMPDNAGASGKEKIASGVREGDADGSSKAPDGSTPREPLDESQKQAGASANQADPRSSAPPPRDPAPTVPLANPSPPNRASDAGGMLSEAVREASGESGGKVNGDVGIEDLKVMPGGDPNAKEPNDFMPLIGLNNGDLQAGNSGATNGDVKPVPANASATPGVSDPSTKPEGAPVVPQDQTPTPAIEKPEVKPDAPAATPQPEQKPAAPSSSVPPVRVEYFIAQGDTFTSIAEDWFGDSNMWSLIAKENPTVDPQKLKIDQRIFLPPKEAAVAKPKPEPVLAEGESVHVVQSGETLIAIARSHFGVDGKWEDIYALNKPLIGSDPAALKVGMKLKLPKK